MSPELEERLFLWVFFLLYFGVPVGLAWISNSEWTKIDVSALWTHNDRPDKLAVIILGTWWVHTTTMILWTLSKTVTTADFITYMGWAIPIIAKMFAPSGNPPQEPKA
mgnify:FL=1